MLGWIKIDRSITNHWLWKDHQKLYWWLDLIFLANYEDNLEIVGQTLVNVSRGQMLASQQFLAKRWLVSTDTVRKFLRLLQSEAMIEQETHSKYNLITISNYDKYQQSSNPNTNLNTDPNAHPSKEYKKSKNKENNTPFNSPSDKKVQRTRKPFIPPTPDEVQAYCDSRNNGISGQAFCDFYQSKGWLIGKSPMKDWRCAVRTWEAKRRQEQPASSIPSSSIPLGPGEYLRPDGSRTYGSGSVTVPPSAPPRPNERCSWSSSYNSWIM